MTSEERKHMLSIQLDLLRHPKVMRKFYETGKLPDVSILHDPKRLKKKLKKFKNVRRRIFESIKEYIE